MRAVAYTPHTHTYTYTQDTHGSEIHVYYTYGGRRNRVHRVLHEPRGVDGRRDGYDVARRKLYAALAATLETSTLLELYICS